jgi:hypothetical protein
MLVMMGVGYGLLTNPVALAQLYVASQVYGLLWAPVIRTLDGPCGCGAAPCFPLGEWRLLWAPLIRTLGDTWGSGAAFVAPQANELLWAPLMFGAALCCFRGV